MWRHLFFVGYWIYYLFHNASFPLGKGGVAPQLVVNKLHLDLHPSFRLLSLNNVKKYWAGPTSVGNFRQNNYSRKTEWAEQLVCSGCSAEQKTFRIIPQRRKKLGILYRGTKKEANSQNFVPNYSSKEKPTRSSVPRNKKRSKFSEFRSEACLGQKHAVNSVCWSRIFVNKLFSIFPFRASELTLP
jgi:hypothetical protein